MNRRKRSTFARKHAAIPPYQAPAITRADLPEPGSAVAAVAAFLIFGTVVAVVVAALAVLLALSTFRAAY